MLACIACDFSSPQYLGLSANEKMSRLWTKINENTKPLGFYSAFTTAGIFLESMSKSFDWVGDEMLDGRKKLIHTVGTVGKVQYISTDDHPYTGVFRGCDNVLLRPSVAKETDPSKSSAAGAQDNFAPGMGIKWLRDGKPSANLQAMFGVNGQASWNFFKNDFSNHIPAASGAALYALALKFSSATKYIQTMGLRDLALYDCKGNLAAKAKYPFELIFRPHSQLKGKYGDTYTKDYLSQLKEVPTGFDIYDVYAIDDPSKPTVQKKIGSLRTTSQMTTSYWGDESMFFKHNYMDDDLKENPAWEKFTPKFSILSGSTTGESDGCPFHLR